MIRRSSRDAARPCNTCMVRGGQFRVAPKVAVYQLVPLGTSATERRAGAGVAVTHTVTAPATNAIQLDYKRSSHRSELLCGALAYESPPSDTVGRHTALRPGGLRLLVAVPRILA